MKLKALLLGSAAAMIAVSGARAADAVVAEPEPMDFVKVCDMYGSGFYYIPGTETCMNINGYVRADLTFNERSGGVATSQTFQYRTRLNFDVRNETDYGTLRSQLRLQGDGDGFGDAVVGVDRALISLAGFRLGYSDSYVTTVHGYGLPGIEKYDGPYGYDQAMFVDYTYAANGFSATVGFQDSVGAAGGGNNINEEYYIGATYTGSFFRVAASYLYENVFDEGSFKVSASVTPVDGLTVKGWYQEDDGVTRQVGGLASDYNWGIGASYAVSDDVTVAAGYSDVDGGESAFTVGLNWQAAPGLSIRPNINFREDTGEQYSLRVYRTF